MKIDAPGIYRDIDVTDYHADCCPEPSLSQSIAKIINDRSPWHAKVAHPRLTTPEPAEEEAYNKAKAIGDAAHALMIGRGKTLAVGGFDSWRTKEAQAFKSEALIAGKTPILDAHFTQAHAICGAAKAQLVDHEENDCFTAGAGEVALIWREGPIWFRCLVDWLHDDLHTVDDFKTSGMSVAEHVLGQRAADGGWDIQAAMIERGLDVLDPGGAGCRRFRFIAQEQDAPHALNVMVMTEHWLTMGRKKLQHAVDLWKQCILSGRWPGYGLQAVRPEYPSFKETQWLNREMEHHERAKRSPMLVSMAGG